MRRLVVLVVSTSFLVRPFRFAQKVGRIWSKSEMLPVDGFILYPLSVILRALRSRLLAGCRPGLSLKLAHWKAIVRLWLGVCPRRGWHAALPEGSPRKLC